MTFVLLEHNVKIVHRVITFHLQPREPHCLGAETSLGVGFEVCGIRNNVNPTVTEVEFIVLRVAELNIDIQHEV